MSREKRPLICVRGDDFWGSRGMGRRIGGGVRRCGAAVGIRDNASRTLPSLPACSARWFSPVLSPSLQVCTLHPSPQTTQHPKHIHPRCRKLIFTILCYLTTIVMLIMTFSRQKKKDSVCLSIQNIIAHCFVYTWTQFNLQETSAAAIFDLLSV